MSKRPNADFVEILSESGVPVTEDEFEAKLKHEVVGAGSKVSNDSEMSPFWRWVRAAVVTPCVWLIRTLLAEHVMPNMFVATAERWALELKAWEHDIEPKDAEKTQGNITLTKANAADAVTIEAGKVVQTLPIDGVVYKVRVLAETVIDAGQLTGKVLVEAFEAGAAFNLPAGYFNIIPEEIPGIVDAVNEPDWITKLGADAESEEELALRIQNAFTSSGEWHIDDVYRSIISSVAGIRSDNIYFNNTGEVTPGTAEALILMEVGATPQPVLDQLNDHIMAKGHHGHGDVLTCKAIPDTEHDVIADVVLVANLDEATKVNELLEVEDRIRAAFRETAAYPEMTRAKPESRFSLSLLGTEIHTNMAQVESVKFTVGGKVQEDIISDLEQPRLKTLTVR
ncbi:baseplate J/gp47 family protein [Vibrio neptunius]|uniref:Baseplate J/gp47 family protein n=1 Tax=Vibrio neptunius TaxID=170651 RepID=A0ABS3A0X4_9VIBR|nr:baseplate J/gp47 family protein [Vibrio neptunius]MBN3492069.1 baseplate J/gp47 family protein [Vibrio neptunius]MBN3514566.1 baseplate J/gp47 family protein [Vibrio neptunius]MBN3549308.1 baseplate J/gp47 family protein [Vibrio neptunius]MBN3576833.1 baseplate J/gp47 family protein [Vibrio neptunius]MCH9870497.1 baseplate J/gp47 family protein [Vibrio neptunius]